MEFQSFNVPSYSRERLPTHRRTARRVEASGERSRGVRKLRKLRCGPLDRRAGRYASTEPPHRDGTVDRGEMADPVATG
jgi:hypothetical protein